MPKQAKPLAALQAYLPDNTLDEVLAFLNHYKVQLTITRNRKSILGDYKVRHGLNDHRISVNGGLNKYAFLITLLHELAHLLTFEKFGGRVNPHGQEWKNFYKSLLKAFVDRAVFPANIVAALRKSLTNPAASSCGEEDLMRVLRQYDEQPNGLVLVEQVPQGGRFAIAGGRVFVRGPQLRKRFKCVEEKTSAIYLFNPLFEVKLLE
jgi:SprT protein